MWFRRQSYDAVPALSIRREALRWSLRRITLAWAIGVVWLTAIHGPHFGKFTRMAGFTDLTLGILAALAYVGGFIQPLAGIFIDRTGLTKYLFMRFALIHRILWLPVGLVLLLVPTPAAYGAVIVLVLVGASWLADGVANPAWLTWMGWLIPPRIRGRYMGRRRQLTTFIGVIAAVIIGAVVWLTESDNLPMTAADQPALAVALSSFLIVGGICGIIDILLFRRVPEVLSPAGPPEANAARRRPLAAIRHLLWEPMGNSFFRSYVLFRTTLMFAQAIPLLYFSWNMFENLKMNALHANILFMVVTPLIWMAVARPIGRAIDRLGRRPVLMLGAAGTVFSIMPWLFIYPDMPPVAFYILTALPAIIGSVAWGAVLQAQYNIALGFGDGQGRSRYLAAAGFYVSLGGILGGLAGGALTSSLGFLQDDPILVGPFLWNNWHGAFAASMVLRGASVLFLIRLKDPGSKPVRLAARQLAATLGRPFLSPWRRQLGPLQ